MMQSVRLHNVMSGTSPTTFNHYLFNHSDKVESEYYHLICQRYTKPKEYVTNNTYYPDFDIFIEEKKN